MTICLIVKGFQATPITAAYDRERDWDQAGQHVLHPSPAD